MWVSRFLALVHSGDLASMSEDFLSLGALMVER